MLIDFGDEEVWLSLQGKNINQRRVCQQRKIGGDHEKSFFNTTPGGFLKELRPAKRLQGRLKE